jgi:hypothetical protein
MVAVPLFPSLVAVIVVLPIVFAVTRPAPATDAMLVSAIDHATALPVSVLPFALRRVALTCRVAPIGIAVFELSETLATGSKASIVNVADFPSPETVTVIIPPFCGISLTVGSCVVG